MDDLMDGIKVSHGKGVAVADGENPIAVDVPKGVPVGVDVGKGVGVSVGGVGVDVSKGGVDVDVPGKKGHGVGVDVGKGGVGVDVGNKKVVQEDQLSNTNRIQARDDDHHDDDWRGGRGWRGNRNGGFRADRARGGRGWGDRGGWGNRGGRWGDDGFRRNRGGRGRGWNRIASVDEADFTSPLNSTGNSLNQPSTSRGSSGFTGNRNPSLPSSSFGPVGESEDSNLNHSDSNNASPITFAPDTNNTPNPTGESTTPVIAPTPFNQSSSSDQSGSNDQPASNDQPSSNDQFNESNGSLIIDNGEDSDHQDSNTNDNDNKVKRDVIRCNGDDDDNRLSCFCDDNGSSNRRWRTSRNGNRVILDRNDLNRRDVESSEAKSTEEVNALSRRHWGHHGGDNWGIANVGVDVDIDHDDWDDDWRPRRRGGNGGVGVGVSPGGGVAVGVGGGDDW